MMRSVLLSLSMVLLVGCQTTSSRVPEKVDLSPARILPAQLEGIKEIRQASWYQFEALKALEQGYASFELDVKIDGFDRAIMLFSLAQQKYDEAILVLEPHLRPVVYAEIETVHQLIVDCYRFRPIEACMRPASYYVNHPEMWYDLPPPLED